jgi:hypothetical protein
MNDDRASVLAGIDPSELFLYAAERPVPHVEGCCEGGTLLEVMPGEVRIAGHLFHIWEPDLFCTVCAAPVRPDLVEALS